jgi:hypothetical protein
MNRLNLSLFQNFDSRLNKKRAAKLIQSGRLFQCCLVRYKAISPGQFSIGANNLFRVINDHHE